MKKRLRKKKHKGEFQQYGFEIEFQYKSEYPETEAELLFDEFIELMEKEKLLFGGGLLSGFITAQKGSVTDSNRTAIENWIISKNYAIISFKLDKKDAWI